MKFKPFVFMLMCSLLVTGCSKSSNDNNLEDLAESTAVSDSNVVENIAVDARKLSDYATLSDMNNNWLTVPTVVGKPDSGDEAGVEKLNLISQMYGTPLDKRIEDVEYVDVVGNLTIDEAIALEQIDVGRDWITKEDRCFYLGSNGLCSFDKEEDTASYCYTSTPPEIYDSISITVLDSAVSGEKYGDSYHFTYAADFSIQNTEWTKGIPWLRPIVVIYNSDDEIVDSIQSSRLYVAPYGVETRGVLRDYVSYEPEGSDVPDLDLNGLYLKVYFPVYNVQGTDTWTGELIDSDKYTAQLVCSDKDLKALIITNTSSSDISFNTFNVFARDSKGYAALFDPITYNDRYVLQPGAVIGFVINKSHGVVNNDIYPYNILVDASEFGIQYKGSNFLDNPDISVSVSLLSTDKEAKTVFTLSKPLYDKSQDAYFVNCLVNNDKTPQGYESVILARNAKNGEILEYIDLITARVDANASAANSYYYGFRTGGNIFAPVFEAY